MPPFPELSKACFVSPTGTILNFFLFSAYSESNVGTNSIRFLVSANSTSDVGTFSVF